MSSRWFSRSFLFDPVPTQDSTEFDADLNKSLQQLETTNSISILCWVEKILLLIDYLQIFSILWVAAQPWPWPYLWTITTRPLLFVNLDFFSMTEYGALAGMSSSINTPKWGKMDNYLFYAFAFAVVQFGVFASIFVFQWYRNTLAAYGTKAKKYVNELITLSLVLSHVLFLPCTLAVFRLYYCDGDDRLSADPEVSCWDWEYAVFVIVCTVLMAGPLLGVPYVTYKYITNNIVYTDSTDHEKRLQIWELQYMLGLDDYWMREQVWVLSSFTRSGAYFRLHIMFFKFILLLFFIFVRESLILQSILFMTFTCTFAFAHTVYQYPYRSWSSNLVLLAVFSMMVVNSTFGMVNCFGVESAVMAASTETLFLGVFNIAALLFIALVFLYNAVVAEVLDWPALRTLNRIRHNRQLASKAARWVETMRDAQGAKRDFIVAPMEIADVNRLEESIRQLRLCWLSARACGSIFETPLSEVLEDLLTTHGRYIPYALRRFPHWDSAYEDGVRRGVFSLRDRQYKLMAPKKRRLLVKLLAFIYIKGNRCNFDMEVAMAHQRERQQLEAILEKKRARRLAKQAKKKKGKFHFRTFSENVQGFLLGGGGASSSGKKRVSGGSSRSSRSSSPAPPMLPEGATAEELQAALDLAAEEEVEGDGDGEREGDEEADEEADEEVEEEPTGIDRFDPADVAEAGKMIKRLHERTELALNKHHNAKKNLALQNLLLNSSSSNTDGGATTSTTLATTTNALHGQSSGGGGILNKISTMDLIKETVDVDEQRDLEELYLLWDEAVQLYEAEEFPGDYEQLDREAENWYTYRGLVSERLELVANTLAQNRYDNDLFDIEGQQVIEEGEDDDDEDEDGNGDEESVRYVRDTEHQKVPLLKSLSNLSRQLTYSEKKSLLSGRAESVGSESLATARAVDEEEEGGGGGVRNDASDNV